MARPELESGWRVCVHSGWVEAEKFLYYRSGQSPARRLVRICVFLAIIPAVESINITIIIIQVISIQCILYSHL